MDEAEELHWRGEVGDCVQLNEFEIHKERNAFKKNTVTKIDTYAHTYIHTHIHTYIHTYISTRTHTCTHIHTHVHTHTCTHTSAHLYSVQNQTNTNQGEVAVSNVCVCTRPPPLDTPSYLPEGVEEAGGALPGGVHSTEHEVL